MYRSLHKEGSDEEAGLMRRVLGRADSSNVQAVMWTLAELGLEAERIDFGHRFGGLDTPEFRARNPNGKIPVLEEDGMPPLWESGAILRYLAGRYGQEDFWPRDPARRAEVDIWAEWGKVNISLGFTGPVFWRVVRTAPAEQDWPAIEAAVAELTRALRVAEARLGGQAYLAGDAFTLADIWLGLTLYRYFTIEIKRADLPNLAAYYARLQARPGYRAHVMVSYEALRVRESISR